MEGTTKAVVASATSSSSVPVIEEVFNPKIFDYMIMGHTSGEWVWGLSVIALVISMWASYQKAMYYKSKVNS